MKKHLVSCLLALAPTMGWTAFPSQFTYQGSLKHNGALVNGTYPMEFRLTNSDGSQTYWTSGVQNISVQEGLYRVELSPINVEWGSIEPYVQVSVNGNVLLPREKLNSAPYALIAKEIAPNSVAQGPFRVMGRLNVGADIPSVLLGVSRQETPGSGVVNTLFGAGHNFTSLNGNRQFLVQQWLTNNTARTYVLGSGYISGTGAPIANDGPSIKFQGLEFSDSGFGFVYNNNGTVTKALTVNQSNGNIGIGTHNQSEKLEVVGNMKVHGAIQNEHGQPASFVNVFADDCGWPHPYLGCPAGYSAAGRWRTGPGGCDSNAEGFGYDNGSIDSGWLVKCVAQ